MYPNQCFIGWSIPHYYCLSAYHMDLYLVASFQSSIKSVRIHSKLLQWMYYDNFIQTRIINKKEFDKARKVIQIFYIHKTIFPFLQTTWNIILTYSFGNQLGLELYILH